MRSAVLAWLACPLLACSEPQDEGDARSAECPYDLSGPVDVVSDDPSFEEFVETAPEVDAEVARIDGVVRVGCAAIASDLGGDPAGLGTTEACDRAAVLVEAIVAANPDVTFTYEVLSDPPSVTISWEGVAADPAAVERLADALEEHLDEVLAASEAAEVQEQIADTMRDLDLSGVESGADLMCVFEAAVVYTNAGLVCAEYRRAALRFTIALSAGG
jgi:hypothetical protein